MRIAILGAESTGKSQLAAELTAALSAGMAVDSASKPRQGSETVALVSEYLREWCAQHGRTPLQHEQAQIAQAQVASVNAAGAPPLQTVVADTTALMTAVYSELHFNDESLYDFAAAHQQSFDLTLITGLDLPWVADGVQRDGPHTREPTDYLLRSALDRASLPYRVVYGSGAVRLENALRAITSVKKTKKVNAIQTIANYSIRTWANNASSPQKREPDNNSAVRPVWAWPCDKCSDPDCEQRLFSRLIESTRSHSQQIPAPSSVNWLQAP